MSAIIILSDTELHKEPVASDKVTVYTDGYRDYFDNTTTVTIANIVTAAGLVTLSHAYVVGRHNLLVSVNGIALLNPGPAGGSTSLYDYTEENETQIQLGDSTVQLMTDYPLTSKLEVRWNKPLPGVRDQILENLQDVPPALSAAVRDSGALRTAPATGSNVLITQDDLDTAINNFAGLTLVPMPSGSRVLADTTYVGINTGRTIYFRLDNATLSGDDITYVANNYGSWGGSGTPITVPTNAKYAKLTVVTDIDAGALSGNTEAWSYASSYVSGPSTDHEDFVSKISINVPNEQNGTDTGCILVGMDPQPRTGNADIIVNITIATSSTVTLLTMIRLDGFYVQEVP